LGFCADSSAAGSLVRWETKLLMLDVASRCIAAHKLVVLRFYSLITGYLQPHQQDVMHVLAIAAQAVHDLVPPEALAPLLRALADRFISDSSRPEAIAAGLNTVRAMAARSPHALSPDLLRDLAMYKQDRDKAVAAAARALITVYRSANPELLAKRDRGRPVTGQGATVS
jgi:protein SDA1